MRLNMMSVESAGADLHGAEFRSTTPLTELIPKNRERLLKSVDRVRDLGEVFTPATTVTSMLDQLPGEIWNPHPSATFLEPACGDGNFLVAILARKLERILDRRADGTLAAGTDTEALVYHGLEALASIYAVDISVENIVGGKPGHEVGARERLMTQFAAWVFDVADRDLDEYDYLAQAAWWVIEHNIQIGNMLPKNPDGRPSGRDELPLIDYSWTPARREVTLSRTKLGDVVASVSDELTLFGPEEPTPIWEGPAVQLAAANSPVTNHKTKVPLRNGRGPGR